MVDERRERIRKMCDTDEQAAEVERIASMGRKDLETWLAGKGSSLKGKPLDILQLIVDTVKGETV